MSGDAVVESAVPAAEALAGARGVTPPSRPGHAGSFLSDVIAELGFATREAIAAAEEEAREPGRTLEQVLLERAIVDDEQLARAVAERHGLLYVDLAEFEPDPATVGLIGRATALRYRAAPLCFAPGGRVVVAFADPVDPLAISDIEVLAKSVIAPVVAGAGAIERFLLPEAVADEPPRSPFERRDAARRVAAEVAAGPGAGERRASVPAAPAEELAEALRSMSALLARAAALAEESAQRIRALEDRLEGADRPPQRG